MSLLGKKILSVTNRAKASGNKERGVFKAFNEAESIGVIYTWVDSQKEKFLQDFRRSLGTSKKVRFLCFNPDKGNTINTENPIFTIAELSIFGQINSEQSNAFQDEPYDFLFHLDYRLQEMTKSIILNSKAHWKIGNHSSDGEGIFDLMIKLNESAGLPNLAEQMLRYVKALK
jgi:hypothetical protein